MATTATETKTDELVLTPPAPVQATPAQIAALKARAAVANLDPQTTASVSGMQAMAYAAVPSPTDRAPVVAASAPIPRSIRPASPARDPMAIGGVSVTTKGQLGTVTTASRLAAAKGNDVFMRAMILAPSASTAMLATSFGDTDMTIMRGLFVKPRVAIAMTFQEDPTPGLNTERFSGSAIAPLATHTFAIRTAGLR